MTAVGAPSRTPIFQLDLDHAEQIMRTFSAITVDPFKNTLFFFFPFLGAFAGNYVEMRANDPAQEAMMPGRPKALILQEVRDLTRAAGIKSAVTLYTTLNHTFSNCGGDLSFTSPALFLPHQHLFRVGNSPFTQEKPQDNLALYFWKYSDDETRFLIARELGHIKRNSHLLRIAIKVSFLAALFVLYATPIGALGASLLFVLAASLHLISERSFQAKMDRIGVDITSRHLNSRERAIQAARSSLDKMRRQNLARRANNRVGSLYITKSGNNLLDFNHPFLTSRIEHLSKNY